ncbi:hypothetical protein CVT25_012547 [Psilocybe cyanescens]|uniref:Uncharacterized protein n=1 Tax=Psilocybe cyanescens TaxID=93625 RepID=A0A409X114_PSICY|nr:hypothetical protein CVT25_012547 [Psilocybe cyanescens]
MYLYVTKKPANNGRRIVLSAISALYLLCMGTLTIQWYYFNYKISINGDTRESIVKSILEGGAAFKFYALSEFLFYSIFVVSDGLLIWRCYHVWGRSKRVILVPSVLLLTEIVFVFTVTVLSFITRSITNSPLAAPPTTILNARVVFFSLANTIIASSLIGYKIYSASHANDALPAGRFTYVLKILFESAAAYSITILVFAINQVLPATRHVGSPWSDMGYYLNAIVITVSGIAPTVLVARTALTSPDDADGHTIPRASGLQLRQFHSQPDSGYDGSSIRFEVNIEMHEGFELIQDEKRIQSEL